MKILITGGAGCIGSYLAERLAAENEVTVLDNFSRGDESLRNMREVVKAFPKVRFVIGDICNLDLIKELVPEFNAVYHLAALPSHRRALEDPHSYALTDVIGTVNVLEAVRLSGKQIKVLFASSNKVYGKAPVPFKEEIPSQPEGPYGRAKLDGEEWCRLYSKYYEMHVVVTRLFHVIGPRSQPDRELSIFVEQILNGQPQIVHGAIGERGEFVSCSAGYTNIYDTVEGLVKAMDYNQSFDIFNLGSVVETPVFEIARKAQELLGKNLEIIKKQMLPHEALRQSADPEKSKKLLGWEAKIPVDRSIEQYIDWRLKIGPRLSAVYH